jgi:hypothetical protein
MTQTLPALGRDEQRLLLACGRLTFAPGDARTTEGLLRRRLEWEAVVAHARFHSVASLVYRNLDRLGAWSRVPDTVRPTLLSLSHRASYQNRAFARENAAILDAFDRAGIPAIVQKGLSLVETVYGDPWLRPLIDLVFLVPRDRLAEAARVLGLQGYRERRASPQEMCYRWCCPQRFLETRRDIGIAVLLQADLVNWPRMHRLAMPPLFDRARRRQVSGHEALVLAPEDQIIYLCLQADNHGTFNRVATTATDSVDVLFTPWMNNRQIRFTDIFETVTRHSSAIDWTTLVERAIESGVDEAVRTSLSLTNALLAPVVAADRLEGLRRPRKHRIRRWLFEHVASPAAEDTRIQPFRECPAAFTSRSRSPSGLSRVVRRFWLGLSPGRQIHLGRLVGLAEFCFPEAEQLRRRYGLRTRAMLPMVYAAHAAVGIVRSFSAYAWRRTTRLLEWMGLERPATRTAIPARGAHE